MKVEELKEGINSLQNGDEKTFERMIENCVLEETKRLTSNKEETQLNESLDNSYSYRKGSISENEVTYSFNSKQRKHKVVFRYDSQTEQWNGDHIFKVDPREDKGQNTRKVIATLGQIIQDFINEYQPEKVYFSTFVELDEIDDETLRHKRNMADNIMRRLVPAEYNYTFDGTGMNQRRNKYVYDFYFVLEKK